MDVTGKLFCLFIIFLIVSGILIIGMGVDIKSRQSAGIPVGTIYSNGTFIPTDGSIQLLSLACQPLSENNSWAYVNDTAEVR